MNRREWSKALKALPDTVWASTDSRDVRDRHNQLREVSRTGEAFLNGEWVRWVSFKGGPGFPGQRATSVVVVEFSDGTVGPRGYRRVL